MTVFRGCLVLVDFENDYFSGPGTCKLNSGLKHSSVYTEFRRHPSLGKLFCGRFFVVLCFCPQTPMPQNPTCHHPTGIKHVPKRALAQTCSEHAPKVVPDLPNTVQIYAESRPNIVPTWVPNILKIWSKSGPNMLQTCAKGDPNMVQTWSKHGLKMVQAWYQGGRAKVWVFSSFCLFVKFCGRRDLRGRICHSN